MKEKFKAAGVVIQSTKTQRYLLVRRSDEVRAPHTWASVGGQIDPGESPEETVIREVKEELGYSGKIQLKECVKYDEGYIYFNFLGYVADEFSPRLNWENDKWGWFTAEQILKDFPTPLHPELYKIRKHMFAD